MNKKFKLHKYVISQGEKTTPTMEAILIFLDRYGHEMETLVKKKKTLFEECTFPCPYHKSQFL